MRYNSDKFYEHLSNTKWLLYISKILKASSNIVNALYQGNPVINHCTDGWDRTSQMCSLSQIMIDGYYRTIEGFEVLIEKDWVYFGHQFRKRCAHYTESDGDFSPIFIQFLDCVHQLLFQFPFAFEFNLQFLIAIAEHTYSLYYGTFLFNNIRERILCKAETKSHSMWTYLNKSKDLYINPFYGKIDISAWLPDDILSPIMNVRNLRIWEEYYMMHVHRKERNNFVNWPMQVLELLMIQSKEKRPMVEVTKEKESPDQDKNKTDKTIKEKEKN